MNYYTEVAKEVLGKDRISEDERNEIKSRCLRASFSPGSDPLVEKTMRQKSTLGVSYEN